jgi:hypothetical protein
MFSFGPLEAVPFSEQRPVPILKKKKKKKKLLGCAINEQLSSYGVEILYILKIRSRTPSE